jgi:hypothetical protein
MRRLPMILALGLTTGCATLFGGGSNQMVSISGAPTSAKFSIRSSSGMQFAQGTMPASVSLPRKNEYQIQIDAAGFQPQTLALTKDLNGWIWVDLIAGVVGFAIDFISGAAWKLQPAIVNVSLQKTAGSTGGMSSHIEFRDKSGLLLFERTEKLVPLAK